MIEFVDKHFTALYLLVIFALAIWAHRYERY